MTPKQPPTLGEAIARIMADPDTRVGFSAQLPEPPLEKGIREKAFMGRGVKYATGRGWEHYHTHDSRRSDIGFPDSVFIRPPRLIVVEWKVHPNTPSEKQERWLDLFRACGIPAYLWYPEDWPIVLEVLK